MRTENGAMMVADWHAQGRTNAMLRRLLLDGGACDLLELCSALFALGRGSASLDSGKAPTGIDAMSEIHESDASETKPAAGRFESLGKLLDARPEVQTAEDAVRLARDQLVGARRRIRRMRRQTARRFRRLGSKRLSEVARESLEFARTHRDAVVAGLVGFMLGRAVRR
jgi:hypothetical protein